MKTIDSAHHSSSSTVGGSSHHPTGATLSEPSCIMGTSGSTFRPKNASQTRLKGASTSGDSHLFEIALKPMSGHSQQREPIHLNTTTNRASSQNKGVRASSNTSLLSRYLALDSNTKHTIK
jgi:hypothetical protein